MNSFPRDRLRKECRYCLSDEKSEKLIDPCHCEGTLKYVHSDCLQDWIKSGNREVYKQQINHLFITKCEICNYEIRYRKSYKYTIFKSFIKVIKDTFTNSKNFFILIIHSIIIYYLIKRIKFFVKESIRLLKTKFRPSILINISHNISVLLSILLGFNDIYNFYNRLLTEKRKCNIEFLTRKDY
jgi:hypothetical protein